MALALWMIAGSENFPYFKLRAQVSNHYIPKHHYHHYAIQVTRLSCSINLPNEKKTASAVFVIHVNAWADLIKQPNAFNVYFKLKLSLSYSHKCVIYTRIRSIFSNSRFVSTASLFFSAVHEHILQFFKKFFGFSILIL